MNPELTRDKIKRLNKSWNFKIFPGYLTNKADFFKDLERVFHEHDCFGWIT